MLYGRLEDEMLDELGQHMSQSDALGSEWDWVREQLRHGRSGHAAAPKRWLCHNSFGLLRRNVVANVLNMPVKTFSISMGERAFRQAKAEADRAGLSMSAWMTRAAREKIQRDAATAIAAADRETGHAWAEWTEANAGDFPPGAGKGAA
jgi:hypothetical protein